MGATSGIGKEVARLLAAKGWMVGIAGRRAELLSDLQASTPGITCHKQIDITSEEAPRLLRQLITELGGMDLYFHSSGIGWQNNQLDSRKELLTMETNGVGFVRMVDEAFNWFAEQEPSQAPYHSHHPHIACITSIAGTKGLGTAPAYSATKRFQNHYIESLEQLARMRHLRISFTDIRPGFVRTALISGSNYPLQLKAEDVAKAIMRAIDGRRRTVTIDWRYLLLVALWRLVPRWLWVRLPIATR